MKILIVSQYFYPENFRINVIAKYMSNHQHQVFVLTGLPNYPDGKFFKGFNLFQYKKFEKFEKLKIYRVPIIPRFNANSTSLFLNYLSFIISACLFSPFLLRKNKFDVIFVYAPSPILQSLVGIYLKFLGFSNIVSTWIQDIWPDSLYLTSHISNKYIIEIIGKLVNFIYSKNDILITSSKDFSISVSQRAPGREIFHIPNPGLYDPHVTVESTSDFIHQDLLTLLKNNDTFKIVYTGNIGLAQSIETIINCAVELSHIKKIKFIIIGGGSKQLSLRELIQKYNLNNIFIYNPLPENCMQFINVHANALLLTLNDNPILNRTVPAKLQGYLSSKKPIIASIGGSSAEIINQYECGFASHPEDAFALANNIKKLFSLPTAEQHRLGENGFRYYLEHYEPNLVTRNLLNVLSKLNRR